MNNWTGIGRLTKDPELRGTDEKTYVCHATIAVDRKYKQDGKPTADYIPLTIYGQKGFNFHKFFGKGSKVVIARSRYSTDSYQNKEGRTIYTSTFIVDEWEFGENKSSSESSDSRDAASDRNTSSHGKSARQPIDDDFMAGLANIDDSDMPWA